LTPSSCTGTPRIWNARANAVATSSSVSCAHCKPCPKLGLSLLELEENCCESLALSDEVSDELDEICAFLLSEELELSELELSLEEESWESEEFPSSAIILFPKKWWAESRERG